MSFRLFGKKQEEETQRRCGGCCCNCPESEPRCNKGRVLFGLPEETPAENSGENTGEDK